MKKTVLALMGFCALSTSAPAEEARVAHSAVTPLAAINLSYPQESEPLKIPIREFESLVHGWKKGDKLVVRAWVESRDGTKTALCDRDGKDSWTVQLGGGGRGLLSILPAVDSFAGRLVVTAGGKTIFPVRGETATLEKLYEYRFDDGARVRVHFTDQALAENGERVSFAREVLDAAVQAYQTITEFQGFSTKGYSFASPDKTYAYDPDATIDVYLGGPSDDGLFRARSRDLSFKDAPCFDTLAGGGNRYDAVILVPANYREFIKSWERINPSSLGTRNAEVDLRGTLMHEMLHVILFYYNRNLSHGDQHSHGSEAPRRKIDWYVEGLARYFETFAGARHDFYSQGFKQTLPDKIRFSRGGSNYFMRYPDQAFTDLRYENALFWRFIDHRYGMPVIERLSRDFRGGTHDDFKAALEKATGVSFDELLKRFALSILTRDFGLKDDARYLKEIARTRMVFRGGALRLVDGFGAERSLGRRASVDWIGSWDDAAARLGEPPAGGDNTEKSDVSPWATDFVEIGFDGREKLPWMGIWHRQGGSPLIVQMVVETRAGSTIRRELEPVRVGAAAGLSLSELAASNGLGPADISRVFFLVTNTDSAAVSDYEIAVS